MDKNENVLSRIKYLVREVFMGMVPTDVSENFNEDFLREAKVHERADATTAFLEATMGEIPRKVKQSLRKILEDEQRRAMALAGGRLAHILYRLYDGKLPSANPIQLEAKNVNHVLDGDILVSPKFDGTRYTLFACRDGVILTNRAGERFLVDLFIKGFEERDVIHHNAEFIVDVEWYNGMFYVFDVIMKNGHDVTHEPFAARMAGAVEGIGHPLVTEKVFTPISSIPRDYEYVETPGLDGMVLTKHDYAYHSGAGYGHFKWKPRRDLTVDMEVPGPGEMPLLKGNMVWDRVISWPLFCAPGVHEYRVVSVGEKVKLIWIRPRTKNPNAFLTVESVFRTYHDFFSMGQVVRTWNMIRDFRAGGDGLEIRGAMRGAVRGFLSRLAIHFLPPPPIDAGRIFSLPYNDIPYTVRSGMARTKLQDTINNFHRQLAMEKALYDAVAYEYIEEVREMSCRYIGPKGRRKLLNVYNPRVKRKVIDSDTLELVGDTFVMESVDGRTERPVEDVVAEALEVFEKVKADLRTRLVKAMANSRGKVEVADESPEEGLDDEDLDDAAALNARPVSDKDIVDQEWTCLNGLGQEGRIAVGIRRLLEIVEERYLRKIQTAEINDAKFSEKFTRTIAETKIVLKPKRGGGDVTDMYLNALIVIDKASQAVGNPEVTAETVKMRESKARKNRIVEIVEGVEDLTKELDISEIVVSAAPHQKIQNQREVLKLTGQIQARNRYLNRRVEIASSTLAKEKLGHMSAIFGMGVSMEKQVTYVNDKMAAMFSPDQKWERKVHLFRGIARNVDLRVETSNRAGRPSAVIELLATSERADFRQGVMALYRFMFL